MNRVNSGSETTAFARVTSSVHTRTLFSPGNRGTMTAPASGRKTRMLRMGYPKVFMLRKSIVAISFHPGSDKSQQREHQGHHCGHGNDVYLQAAALHVPQHSAKSAHAAGRAVNHSINAVPVKP